MLFLDIAPRATTRVFRFRAERALINSWAKVLEARVQSLASQGDRGVLISKGSRQAEGPGPLPGRPYVNLDSNGQLLQLQVDLGSQDQEVRIADRAQAIEQLEGDMTHVHGMFQDLASLVMDQGEGLERIDANLGVVEGRVGGGLADLEVAHKRC